MRRPVVAVALIALDARGRSCRPSVPGTNGIGIETVVPRAGRAARRSPTRWAAPTPRAQRSVPSRVPTGSSLIAPDDTLATTGGTSVAVPEGLAPGNAAIRLVCYIPDANVTACDPRHVRPVLPHGRVGAATDRVGIGEHRLPVDAQDRARPGGDRGGAGHVGGLQPAALLPAQQVALGNVARRARVSSPPPGRMTRWPAWGSCSSRSSPDRSPSRTSSPGGRGASTCATPTTAPSPARRCTASPASARSSSRDARPGEGRGGPAARGRGPARGRGARRRRGGHRPQLVAVPPRARGPGRGTRPGRAARRSRGRARSCSSGR